MREWLFALVPIAVITFFLAYPDQLKAFTAWLGRLIH